MAKHRRQSTAPTQVTHPWRATLRVAAIVILSLLPVLPALADAADIDEVPLVVSVLAIAAALQRIIILPPIDALLTKIGLGAKHRNDYLGEVNNFDIDND